MYKYIIYIRISKAKLNVGFSGQENVQLPDDVTLRPDILITLLDSGREGLCSTRGQRRGILRTHGANEAPGSFTVAVQLGMCCVELCICTCIAVEPVAPLPATPRLDA